MKGYLDVGTTINSSTITDLSGIHDYANISFNGKKVSIELAKIVKENLTDIGFSNFEIYITRGCSIENELIKSKIDKNESVYHYIIDEENGEFEIFCNIGNNQVSSKRSNEGRASERNGEDLILPLNIAEKSWYYFIGYFHVLRAYEYAVKNSIKEKDFHFTTFEDKPGERSQVLIHQTFNLGNTTEEYKSIFRALKGNINLDNPNCRSYLNRTFHPYCNDTYLAPFNNYYDDNGKIIFWEDDLSERVTIVSLGGGGSAKAIGKLGEMIVLAGQANKTWAVYTFILLSKKNYYGITTQLVATRIAQHINKGKTILFGDRNNFGFIT